MPSAISNIMEQASGALARRDYLECENLCLQALTQARQKEQWTEYVRILLPLQECRRQRRMIAANGAIHLGTADLHTPMTQWLDDLTTGCIVLTHPHTLADANDLQNEVTRRRLFVDVLFADNDAKDERWTLRSPHRVEVQCDLPAPLSDSSADWFIDASEALGDQALATVRAPMGSRKRVELIETLLDAVGDHERLHQALGQAVRSLIQQSGKA